jgi:hypothetical protein
MCAQHLIRSVCLKKSHLFSVIQVDLILLHTKQFNNFKVIGVTNHNG